MKRVSDLKKGEGGTISELTVEDVSIKLMEVGCIPGEYIEVVNVAPLGDPISVSVWGILISMRKNEAKAILVDN